MAGPYTFKWKRDSTRRWAGLNPILAEGEPGLELDTGKFKIGDGNTRWLELPYFTPGDGSGGDPGDPPDDGSLAEHINSLTPHPVYDDGPSFELLYENAKV